MPTVYETDEEIAERQTELAKATEQAKIQAMEDGLVADDLEESLNGPAATDEDLPDGHPDKTSKSEGDSAGELKTKESEPEDNTIGDGFKQDKTKKSRFRGSVRNRRNAAIAAVVTLIVSGTAFMLSIVSGPAQFLHITQLMDKFHFSSREDDSSSRLFKLTKAIRNRKTPERNRLSILGNKMADRWTTKLKESGINLEYNPRTGAFQRFVLDPEILARNPQMDGLKNSSNEEIQRHFREKFDITVTIDAKTKLPVIEAGDLGFFKARRLDKIMFRTANYTKAGAALGTRTISKRQGLTWHPIKKLDASLYKTLDAKFTQWQKNRSATLDEGKIAPEVTSPRETVDNNGDGSPDSPSSGDAETNAGTSEVEKTIAGAEGAEAGKFTAAAESIRTNTAVKSAGALSLLAGITCLAQGLSAQYDKVQYNNVALPLMRVGMDAVSTGSQVMGSLATGKGLDIEQLGFLAKKLNDPKNGGSWTNAKSIQAKLGEPQTGPDIPSEARLDKESSPVTQFLNNVPGLPTICGALNSGVGQVVTFGIDIITGGPLSSIFGQVTSRTIAPYLTDHFMAAISGAPLDVAKATGAILGNFINYGAFLSSNDAALRSGARILTKSETEEIENRQLAIDKEDFSQKSFAGRIFDFTDERSLAGKILDDQSPNFSGNLATMVSSMFNIKTAFHGVASMIRPQRVSAAADYDFGIPKIGFTTAELEDPRLDDPFANSDIVKQLLQDPATKSRVEKCFSVAIADDMTITSNGPALNYADLADPANNCGSTDFNWTRIRIFILDSTNLESYACYEGIDDIACNNIGIGNASPGSGL